MGPAREGRSQPAPPRGRRSGTTASRAAELLLPALRRTCRHHAKTRVAHAHALEGEVIGEGERLHERAPAVVHPRFGPRAVVRVAPAHLAARVVKHERYAIVAPHGRLERGPPTHELADVRRPVPVHREVAFEQSRPAPEGRARVQHMHEPALVVVAQRRPQRRRRDRGPRREQAARPGGAAEKHDARVDPLRVPLFVGHLVVAPHDELDPRRLVLVQREREVHVAKDGVVVDPEEPFDSARGARVRLGEHGEQRHLVPLPAQVPRAQQLCRGPHRVAMQSRILQLILEGELD